MMDRVRAGLAIAGGSALILLACGIKGPARPPLPPPAAAPQPAPVEAPQPPLEPTTEPSTSVVRPGAGTEAAPSSGTTRELPPDGGP